jgi:glycyl-tRNA synthetase alpha chain
VRPPTALRHRSWRRHHAPGNVPSRPRSHSLSHRLRPAIASTSRRTLRREPKPTLQAFSISGILKPAPSNIQELYLHSLEAIGIRLSEHDVRFEEDNWESPTLGAWGIGWQILLDGQEITQFTYFQQSGGLDLDPISVEITYGLERICAFLQNVESVYEIQWTPDKTYGDIRLAEEQQLSEYSFDRSDAAALRAEFEIHEKEAKRLLDGWKQVAGNVGALTKDRDAKSEKPPAEPEQLELGVGRVGAAENVGPPTFSGTSSVKERARYPLLAAYDHCLKCSHLFNMMDARGVISTPERAALMARVRTLSCRAASAYLEQIREAAPAVPAKRELGGHEVRA